MQSPNEMAGLCLSEALPFFAKTTKPIRIEVAAGTRDVCEKAANLQTAMPCAKENVPCERGCLLRLVRAEETDARIVLTCACFAPPVQGAQKTEG